MSNKRVQISDDGGSTWVTLPGNQGELRLELNQTNDTIFGQAFESNNPNLGGWQINGNSLFKGVAGYNASIKKSGDPTAMTGEAMSLVSGKTYQITASAKRVISLDYALTVLDNGVDHTADVQSIDYLTGKVTFKSAYTPTTPVTITGRYLPLSVANKARSFTLNQSQAQNDSTGYEDAQSEDGFRLYEGGLKTIGLEVGGIFRAANNWFDTLTARDIIFVEIDLDVTNAGVNVVRGLFKLANFSQSGNQGDIESDSKQFVLYVPDGDLVVQPFGWYIGNTSRLSQAVQKGIAALAAQSVIQVRYLPSGAPGQSPLDGMTGDAIISEFSLANSIDGQNEFTVNFRGVGAPTAA